MLTEEQVKAITPESYETNDVEPDDLFAFFGSYNNHKFNLTKLAEELSELSEVTLKMVNKSEKYQPNPKLFVEEAGDTFLRMMIVGMKLFPIRDEEIDLPEEERTDFISLLALRCEKKLKGMVIALQQGKYKNGI